MQTTPLAPGAAVRLAAGRYWFGCAEAILTKASMKEIGPQQGTGIDQMLGHDGEITGVLFKSPWLPCDIDIQQADGQTVRISDESFAVVLVPVDGRGVLPDQHRSADIAGRGCFVESPEPIDALRDRMSVQVFTAGGRCLLRTRMVDVDWT